MSDECNRDDAARAAFANFKAHAADAFPAPPVDELLMSGPARLRRRRLVSLAAVVGACTAVTAGGFAVAQTLGPLTGGGAPAGPDADVVESSTSEADPSTELGTPIAPSPASDKATEEATAETGEPISVLILGAPEGEWAASCLAGPQAADFEAWSITAETGWSIAAAVGGDADGDGEDEDDAVLSLTCDGLTGVAAFEWVEAETGPTLQSIGWIWQPEASHASHELSEITGLEAGVITLQGLDDASATWTARYEWDGEAFVLIDDATPAEPGPSATTATPEPDETPATDTTPTSTGSAS